MRCTELPSSIPARAGVEASYCGLPTRLDRLEFEERGGRMSIWADLRLTLSKTTKPVAVTTLDDAPRTAAYQFPEVLPLRIKASGGAGKVIPMRRTCPLTGVSRLDGWHTETQPLQRRSVDSLHHSDGSAGRRWVSYRFRAGVSALLERSLTVAPR